MKALETKKAKTPRGTYCGFTTIAPHGLVDVFTNNNQFLISKDNKFLQFVKASALRVVGIYENPNNKRKKIFGATGYIGCPKSR